MAVAQRTYQATPTNMVQAVRNIVEGYKMGPLRALAQDPVQNAYDARRPGVRGPVRVEYRLHKRKLGPSQNIYMLTVTDSNTTGLRGPALSMRDLEQRANETGYLQLDPNENWAAWEAMGYTKVGEDSLGTRGQGKAAFLYHARYDTGFRDENGRSLEGMIILYDSLLADESYRLGVRLAQPADLVTHPPFRDEEARAIVAGEFSNWNRPAIPLRLEPLAEIGTRIIVPFLNPEAVEAVRAGELANWLERCWWRAIQVGDLEISVVTDSGESQTVQVPSWWEDEPWMDRRPGARVHVQENLRLERRSPLRIKRLVLFYDPELPADEIEDYPSQYSGVQLLRHRQWVETLGAEEKFADFVPRNARAGFRGFVEFGRRLERELREIESPQHDTFKRHRTFVKQIDAIVREAVRGFAESQGWVAAGDEGQRADQAAEEVLKRIVDIFLTEPVPGSERRAPETKWDCGLEVEFPRSDVARVEWNELLRNILVSCSHDPPDPRTSIVITLDLIAPGGERTELDSRQRTTRDGHAVVEFGEIEIVRVARRERQVACQEPGRYRIRAACSAEGHVLTSASRIFHVRQDPPGREVRPISAGIAVTNASAERVRINNGDEIDIAITVSSRTSDQVSLTVNGSLGDLLFADSEVVELPGRPLGDTPASRMLVYRGITVFTDDLEEEASGQHVVLEPGRHYVRADVLGEDGQIVANAVKAVFVETDPEPGAGGLPFDVRFREEPTIPHPVWELEPPHGNGAAWILWCARHHPVYKAAAQADQARRPSQDGLYGTKLYFAETFCSALVEWALGTYRDQGDEGGFKLLVEAGGNSPDVVWERYRSKIEELIASYEDSLACLELRREVVSLMLYRLEQPLA